MAQNREAYEQAMNAGHNAAWDQEWALAIDAYGRAVSEFPSDPEAHIHLGLALLKAGRLDDALKVYSRAHQLGPDDPIPLEKSADVLEQMGRLKEAAQQYINVAELYLGQRDLEKAIGNWERATRLTPGLIPVHAKLAQAYERVGDKKKAIREYLQLAFNFQRMTETEKAQKAVQRALKLDKRNSQALNALRALETGGEILPPDDADFAEAPAEAPAAKQSRRAAPQPEVGEADPRGPIGEAMTDALGMLAMFVMESGQLDAAGGDALEGMELQRQEIYDQAIEAYLRAEPKLRHPALKMNLGALLVLQERPEEAVKHLGEAVANEQLAPGALHGLGRAHHKLGKYRQGSRFLIQSLQAVDTSLATSAEEAEELAGVYESLLQSLNDATDETMQVMNERFLDLMTGADWKQRISSTRRQIDETIRSEDVKSAVEQLVAGEGGGLGESVNMIDRYIRQGLYVLAMDSAHRAVEVAPTYLPVHVRMAEIMMREGRLRQAITKYNVVAKTYLARGENDRAAAILGEVLEMAPLDISVRKNLIELLEGEERWDETLDQHLQLADTYHQLGNFELSRDTYNTAERLANKIGAPVEKTVQIKHRMADIDQMRLDTRKAQRLYEEIVSLAPEDERARRMLIDLNYRQGNQVEAIKRLDELLTIYAKKRQIPNITKLLEELVTLYPDDTGLRARLADIYQHTGRKGEAIKQLDALGELQLEAGLHQDAVNTIRKIISLKPDGLEDYQRLLAQLGG